jgi:hypothetical protein
VRLPFFPAGCLHSHRRADLLQGFQATNIALWSTPILTTSVAAVKPYSTQSEVIEMQNRNDNAQPGNQFGHRHDRSLGVLQDFRGPDSGFGMGAFVLLYQQPTGLCLPFKP